MNNISFPGLGLSFDIDRVAFSVFGLDIYWYALLITLGIVLAYLYCTHMGKREGLSSDTFIDILLWGIPSGVVGGVMCSCVSLLIGHLQKRNIV